MILVFQDTCFYSLIQDYMNYGVCEQYNSIYPTTNPCVLDEDGLSILKGVCSEETEQKFKLIEKCFYDLRRQRQFIQYTLAYLIMSMCNYETSIIFFFAFIDYDKRDNNITAKVPPYLSVDELHDGILSSYIPYGKQEID